MIDYTCTYTSDTQLPINSKHMQVVRVRCCTEAFPLVRFKPLLHCRSGIGWGGHAVMYVAVTMLTSLHVIWYFLSCNQSIPFTANKHPHMDNGWSHIIVHTYVPSLRSQWLYQSTWRWCRCGTASWPPRSRLGPTSDIGNQSWAGQWGRSTAVPRQNSTVLRW